MPATSPGEAAAHAHTWSAITQVQAAYNRHEIPPTTTDWVNIDHRRGIAFAPGDVTAYIGATWELTPDAGHIEAVHRLSDLGVVVTEVVAGTSQAGFDVEWREIGLFAVEGDLVCRFEIFDEADLDAALARFDELRHAGTAAGKRGNAERRTASSRTSRPATGRRRRR